MCGADALMPSHSYVNWLSVRDLIAPLPLSYNDTAMAEVFNKTLALFSAITEQGCALKTELSSVFDGSDEDPDNDNEEEDNSDNEIMPIFGTECSGKLVM